jgi:hypothetical protein
MKYLICIVCVQLLLTGCNPFKEDDLSERIDHWEISRTFRTYDKASLLTNATGNDYKVAAGDNQVLIVTTENKPVFKKGKEVEDLYSSSSLLIELDKADTLVTAKAPSRSVLLRLLLAFSPDYGIKPLPENEKLTLRRKAADVWLIDAQMRDFDFRGELDFSAKQTLTDKFIDD